MLNEGYDVEEILFLSSRSRIIAHFDNWMHECACRNTHDWTMWVYEGLKCKLLRKWLRSCASGKECVREWVVGREGKWVVGEWNESGIHGRCVGMCLRKWRELLRTYLCCRLLCISFNMKVIMKEISPNFEPRSRTLLCRRAGRQTKLEVIGPLMRVYNTPRTFRISSSKWELGVFSFHTRKSSVG